MLFNFIILVVKLNGLKYIDYYLTLTDDFIYIEVFSYNE